MLSGQKITSPILYSFACQTAILLPVFLLLLGFSVVFAYSFLLGAAVFVVANLYFTAYASRAAHTQSIHWVLKKIKQGQMGKFVLSALGFALVFRFFQPLAAFAVFFGFFLMILLQSLIAAKLVVSKAFYARPPGESTN